MSEIIKDDTFVWGIMALLIFAITQGLKWLFVKRYTKNLDNKKKTVINSVILIIVLGVAIFIEYLYSHFCIDSTMSVDRILGGWGGASGVYAIFDFITRIIDPNTKVDNPFQTPEAEIISEVVEKVVEDEKIDEADAALVTEYLEKLKNIK